jgi:hypothetical protein
MGVMLVGQFTGFAQNRNFQTLEFKSKSDYRKYEPEIKEMADYVLANPIEDSDARKTALMNIIKWMTGSPDHHFIIDSSVTELSKNDEDVLYLYMASAAKAALHFAETNAQQLKLKSVEILLDYCSIKANGVKVNKEMKRAMSAKENGKLKEYLNI